MGKVSKIEIWINDLWFNLRLKGMNSLLRQYGMDWGKYPLEEICKIYSNHKDEIRLD